MAPFQMERSEDYSVISKHHLRSKELTLKENAASSKSFAGGYVR